MRLIFLFHGNKYCFISLSWLKEKKKKKAKTFIELETNLIMNLLSEYYPPPPKGKEKNEEEESCSRKSVITV